MTDVALHIVVFLNQIANLLGELLLKPLEVLPLHVGAIAIDIVSGAILLMAFKFTSNQTALRQVRSRIKANILALSLFNESAFVTVRSQCRILAGVVQSLRYALVPTLVMMVPVTLMLGQLSLWWQARPLQVGEEAVLTIRLTGDEAAPWPSVKLRESDAFAPTTGPVKIRSERAVCWNVEARHAGYYLLTIDVGDDVVKKEIAIGGHPMRTSLQRPGQRFLDILLNPAEQPFAAKSVVGSIEIEYHPWRSWLVGRDRWLISWFVGSMLSALCLSRIFRVSL